MHGTKGGGGGQIREKGRSVSMGGGGGYLKVSYLSFWGIPKRLKEGETVFACIKCTAFYYVTVTRNFAF